MKTIQKSPLSRRLQYPVNAYRFLFSALRYTQERLGRTQGHGPEDERAHISGPELLKGIRDFAREQFGLMTLTVFHTWNIHATDDFGRMVFELIDRGEMRKTNRDQISDFYDLYDFEDAFDRQYKIDMSQAFGKRTAEPLQTK